MQAAVSGAVHAQAAVPEEVLRGLRRYVRAPFAVGLLQRHLLFPLSQHPGSKHSIVSFTAILPVHRDC